VDERNITVNGQQIAFTQSGGSGRPVIFVHGNSSSARTWRPVMTGPFGQRYRCLALDLPGHGSSAPAKNRENYSLPGYAAVLAGFAEAENTADAVIVGWSLGGRSTTCSS
jgi:pimeloyl-ACP methyl ester carboxylesterase